MCYIEIPSQWILFDAHYFHLCFLCLLKARTLSCCTGFCTSGFSLRVVFLSTSFSLFGLLPFQDHQTVQHKSDWQCITIAMCFSFIQSYCVKSTKTRLASLINSSPGMNDSIRSFKQTCHIIECSWKSTHLQVHYQYLKQLNGFLTT